MNILDVLLKHFSEDVSSIVILTLCPIDDWFLRIKLIINAGRVIAESTWFLLLLLISGAIISPQLTMVK